MESALPLLLFLAFLFGSVLLILITGIQTREEERREEAPALGLDAVVHAGPRFFARLDPVGTTSAGLPSPDRLPACDGMHAHLQSEWRMATEFVNDPCIESLYRHANPEVEALAAEIQRYLEAEQRFAHVPATESRAERPSPSPAPRGPLEFETAVPGWTVRTAQRAGEVSR